MKLLVWDFDGTLAYRHRRWSGALAGVLARHAPELAYADADLSAALQTGFPWHVPNEPHPHLCDADSWWNEIEAVFARAFCQVGLRAERAAPQ
jgi:putative hydrolase of the HAD superfamily